MKTTLAAAFVALGALPAAAQDNTMDAIAQMVSPDGSDVGTVTMTEGPNGVLVQGVLRQMPPGPHGFHLHETGACEPDFEAAGGHYAPNGNEHGFLVEGGPHAGDMPNLHVGADGIGRIDVFLTGVTLGDYDRPSLLDPDGTAVMVHSEPDSYLDEARAGERIACGQLREAN